MAMAERHLAAVFGDDLVDHHTYVLASDGDLMEGISQEAIALAGHLKLNKLIVLFDDNGISIDGAAVARPTAVDQVGASRPPAGPPSAIDGHDPQRDRRGDRSGANVRPADLIACKTIIGFGAPTKAGTAQRTARRSAPRRSPARARRSAGHRRRSKCPPTS